MYFSSSHGCLDEVIIYTEKLYRHHTWVRRRDPDEAFFSNEEYFYKFFILDTKYTNLEIDADLNWGKFKNQDMPLIVWEPNDQELIKNNGLH